jgi:hypothetical protein
VSTPRSSVGREDGLAFLAIAATVLSTFAPAVFTSLAFYERDILGYWYPGIEAFQRAVREGVPPLWNPYLGFGAPQLADASLQLAYPPTWLSFLMPKEEYYKLFVLLHSLLAGLGVHAYALRLGGSRFAAVLSGCAFAACGPLVSSVSLFHHFAGAAWMPAVLAALEAVLGGRRGAWLGLGTAGAFQVLAGSGDLCLMTAMAGVLRLACHLAANRSRLRKEAVPVASSLFRAGVLAAAIAAVQWMTTVEVTLSSTRLAQPHTTSTYWSVHPLALLDLVVPRLLADFPMTPSLRAEVFESRGPLLRSLYLGIPLLSLAAVGAFRRGARAAALGLAALFFLLCALGRHTPFYALLLHVPGVGVLRYPVKYTLAFALVVAVLGGLGFEAWRHDGMGRRALIGLAAVDLVFAMACLAGTFWLRQATVAASSWVVPEEAAGGLLAPRDALLRSAVIAGLAGVVFLLRSRRPVPERWLSFALVGLVLVDLVSVGMRVNRLAPSGLLAFRPAIADRLRDEGARLYVAMWPPECWDVARGPKGWEIPWIRALGEQQSFSPPVGVRWGISGSYDGEFTGLGTAMTGELTAALREREGTSAGMRLLRLGAVSNVVAAIGEHDRLGLPVVADLPSVYACPLRLLRVDESLPRASVVDGVRREPSGDAIAALLDPAFDPRQSVLLPSPAGERPPSPSFEGSARIVSTRTDRLEIDVEASSPGHLVVREAFATGWRAFVDGRPAPALRADVLFRAVEVPAGRHKVELLYRPAAAVYGLFVSLTGAATAIVLWVRLRLKPPPSGDSMPANSALEVCP